MPYRIFDNVEDKRDVRERDGWLSEDDLRSILIRTHLYENVAVHEIWVISNKPMKRPRRTMYMLHLQ